MKKVDLFFVVILFLVSALAVTFISFDYHLSGIAFEKNKNKILEQKISKLNLIIEAYETKENPVKRGLASIGSVKAISMDELYIEQLKTIRVEKNKKISGALVQKIIANSINPEILAQAYYVKAEINCATYLTKENSCLSDIEIIIGQFPESEWAGDGLILLSEVYAKQRRFKEASSVLKIVRTEFPKQQRLIVKANQLEKKMF
ncbi:MAG: hypothetical protein WA160_03725 [Pseudobdellovibrio sp.]